MASCVWIPSTKEGTPYKAFPEYKKALGYKTAWNVFKISISDDYLDKYKNTLVLDEQGAPSLESTMKTPFMKKYISKEQRKEADHKSAGFIQRDDTVDGYNLQMQDAKRYNSEEHDFLATIVETGDGNLEIRLVDRTDDNLAKWNDELSGHELVQELVRIFSPLGVTVGTFEGVTKVLGVTDFSKAKQIAGQFRDLIRVANNRQGAMAMSEEFAHLIIGIAREDPLVQRAIEAFIADPSAIREVIGTEYDEYVAEYGTDNLEDLAEEALGKLLVEAMKKQQQQQIPVKKSYIQRVVDRVVEALKRMFRRFNDEDVTDAIQTANYVSSQMAKRMFSKGEEQQLSAADIEKARRDKRFYRLTQQTSKLIDSLNKVLTNELKKRKILELRGSNLRYVDNRIGMLDTLIDESSDPTPLGIIKYLSAVESEIRVRMRALQEMAAEPERFTDQQRFKELRKTRDTIQSYDTFLTELKRAIETEMLDESLVEYGIDGSNTNLKDLLTAVREMNDSLKGEFADQAFKAFLTYLQPFLGDVSIKAKDGKEYILKELLEESKNGDITAFDDWLTNMAQSKDVVGQLFDKVIKEAKNRARTTAIDDFQDIARLQQKAKELGVANMDWLFERDEDGNLTGNYVSAVNYGQFEKEVKEEQQRLNEEYADDPTAKAQAWREWRATHCSNTFGKPKPNTEMYRNEWFLGLADDDPHMIIYKEIMAIKERCDGRAFVETGDTRAIQRRKTSDQRFFDMLTLSPSQLWDNIKEDISSDFTVKEDDLEMAGISRSLTDFGGAELFTVQMPYVRKLNNPNELSTDIWGTLAAYAYASANCHEMRLIQNPLEVGYIVTTEQRGYPTIRSGNRVVEMVDKAGNRFIEAKTPGSHFAHKLRATLDAQVYGRRLTKDITFKIPFIDAEFSVNKTVSWILGKSSVAALAFNWLNDTANIVNGIAMTNIEVAGGRYFGRKELAKADKAYTLALKEFVPDLNRPFKQSKLALFDQELDVNQNFTQKVHGNKSSKLISKLFNTSFSFITQDAGNHWLYNRVAIAMAMREKVKVNGEEMSLWDALTVKEEDGKYKLDFAGVATDMNGNPLTRKYLSDFGLRVAEVNHNLFGVYNPEDMNAAQRTNLGRLLLAFRKWMVPLFRYRFKGRQYNVTLQTEEEGIYVSLLTFFKKLSKSPTKLATVWNSLDDTERENCWKCLVEMMQFGAVALLVTCCGFGKGDGPDKDRPWLMQFAEYLANREFHELGNLAPSPVMIEELLKTVQSPFAAASHAANLIRFFESCIFPWQWNDEIKSGPYKGMSTLHKNALKSPIPYVSQYRNIDKFMDKLEHQTLFYSKKF